MSNVVASDPMPCGRWLRALRCLGTALAACLLVSPPALAKPLHQVVASTEYFVTDGERFAAYGDRNADLVHVIDTRTGRAFTDMKDIHCQPNVESATTRVAAAGQLLLWCDADGDGKQDAAVRLDLRTGVSLTLPRATSEQFGFYDSIGDVWLDVSGGGRFLDWRTGRTAIRTPFSARSEPLLYDLDSSTLRRVACLGALSPGNSDERFYAYPFAIGHAGGGSLYLARCGQRRRLLDRRGADLGSVSAGAVTWARGEGFIGAYITRSKRFFHWRVRTNRRQSTPISVTHTHGRVFVLRTLSESNDSDEIPSPATVRVLEGTI